MLTDNTLPFTPFSTKPTTSWKVPTTGLLLTTDHSMTRALARISELGVQKYIFGWIGCPIPFHPIALYTKNMDSRVSKISKRVSKRHPDTPLAKALSITLSLPDMLDSYLHRVFDAEKSSMFLCFWPNEDVPFQGPCHDTHMLWSANTAFKEM